MGATTQPEAVSFGRRLTDLAQEDPEQTALIFVAADGTESHFSRQDLDERSNQIARMFAERGVEQGSTVVVGLPNCPEHIMSCFATWKLGAMTLPLRAEMPAIERDAMLDLAAPALVVTDWEDISWPSVNRIQIHQTEVYDDGTLPDRVANPGRAMGSGGSTGRPKVIIRKGPWAYPPGTFLKIFGPLGFKEGTATSLIPGPLYHEAPFLSVCAVLFEGRTVILMERFVPELVLDLIEHHQAHFMTVAPIMMQRLLDVPDIANRDLSSLIAITHTGAPCAPWLKQAWIDLLGPERITEIYGGTEGNGYAMNNGVDWLEHPGTVGKPFMAEMKILGERGEELPPGEVGRIFARSTVAEDIPFEYVGADQAPRIDDFTWIGDLGWIDEDGYVYLADRRTDLIISGGANVFAAEVEAALSEHPGVADVVVVGLPDETWGKRVHAIIQPHETDNQPAQDDLNAWCRERLSAYKCPKTYEFVAELPRNEAGKIRRSALAAERKTAEGAAAPVGG
ncbi:MAG: AMP-binding protein [Thermomicrobiales bacterium]